METNYIQFPKELRDEIALLYEFKNKYSELRKEYEKLLKWSYGYISLNALNRCIGEKLQYAKKFPDKNPEIKALMEFKIKYIDLYEEVRNAFLNFNYEFPRNAKMNTENLTNDIIHNLLNNWLKDYINKLLVLLEIKKIEN